MEGGFGLKEPPDAWDWHGATQIELMHNNISELPQSPNCPRLEVLYLHGNANLIEIPTLFFQHMPVLQVLDLSHTGIQGLPSSFFKLAQLKTLYLRGCEQLKQLPLDIVQLKNLEKLDLDGTPIANLPVSLNFPRMRSLLLGGNLDLMEMAPSFFDHMPLLTILDLSRTSIHELPSSFFNLQELRELYLNECELFMELSPEIGRLRNLKRLDLDGTQITHLPTEIQELTNLESLSLSFSGYHYRSGHGKKSIPFSRFAMIPPGIISKLTHLEDLRIDVNPDNEWWHENVEHIVADIVRLKRLRKLELYVPEVKVLKLLTSPMYNFRFIVGHHMQRIISRAPPTVEVKFKLSNRSIRFVNGVDFPNEVKNILQYAQTLFLDRHMTINHLFQFGLKNLQQLQSCILAECNEMQSIVDGDGEDSTKGWFLSLEFLTIFYMKSLKSIVQGLNPPNYHFSRLKFLALHTCYELTTIFPMHLLDNLSNLEELIVEDCPKVSSIVNCQSSEQRADFFLPKLRKLSLLYLPALVNISNGLHIGESLENIGFYYCPKVESLSFVELSSKKLKVIRGEIKWWEALKWSETDWGQKGRPSHFSHIFFPIDEEVDVLTQLTFNSNVEKDSGPTHVRALQEYHTHNSIKHFSLAGSTPKSNEDSNFSLNKLERPPLKRLETHSIPASTSTANRYFDLMSSIDDGSPPSNDGDFPNEQRKHPSFLGPIRIGGAVVKPANTQKVEFTSSMGAKLDGDFLNEKWKYSSSLGSTRRRSASVEPAKTQKLEFSNLIGAKLDGDQNKEGSSSVIPAPPTNSSSSTSASEVFLTALSSALQQSKHNLILLSITFGFGVLASYSINSRLAKLEGEKINIGCENGLCYKNGRRSLEKDDGSFSNILNINFRKAALIVMFFTLILPFWIYQFIDYLPPIINFARRTKNNMKDVLLKKRSASMVDVFSSTHPYAKLFALPCAILFLIGFNALALYALTGGSFAEALWHCWTYIADSGNHAETDGTGQRIVFVSISLGGMLVFAMLLGLFSDAILKKVDSLRKGKSEFTEMNHILILGWSNKLGSLLRQLAIANKSLGGGVIVVLAEKEKEKMEMDIAKLEFDFMGTSVICRSGSPLILADLKKVSVSTARAIIVLASDKNADQSDAHALRVVLSLTGVREGLKGHVVVEMSDLDNEALVKLVGGELIETLVARDAIGRLMIQCTLQPGLAQIWEDLLGFENAEFYIKRWPELDGLYFKDVLISFPDAVPCGIKVAADGGKIIINPDDSYVLRDGDEVLVIAKDDGTYAPGPLPEVRNGLFPRIPDPPKYPEKILFCGWRRDIDDMIMFLEAFLAPGSELWMFNEAPAKEREKKLIDSGLDVSGLVNIKLIHREGNGLIRRHLESLPLETFDSILILADELVEDSVACSDSRSLATLLLIRDIQSKRRPHKYSKSTTSLRLSGFSHSSWIRDMQRASDKSIIISEILDSRTRNLLSVPRISDYVLSNELVSMALAMVAEDKQINRVLEELFAEEGNEVCIKPAEFYLFDQEELCFCDIMIRGRQRSEIVIGYRLANQERAIINPSEKSLPRKWSLDDVFVVIALGN